MKTQSNNSPGAIGHLKQRQLILGLLAIAVAFGVTLFAVMESVAVSTSGTGTAPAVIRQEMQKDAWIERGTGEALAAYNVQRQESLKDAHMERGVASGNQAYIAHEAAKDAWLERLTR